MPSVVAGSIASTRPPGSVTVPDHTPSWVSRVESMITWWPLRVVVRSSSIAAARAVKVRSQPRPCSFGSTYTRSTLSGVTTSMPTGPTVRSNRSRAARRDACRLCWTPSTLIVKCASATNRFGYRPCENAK